MDGSEQGTKGSGMSGFGDISARDVNVPIKADANVPVEAATAKGNAFFSGNNVSINVPDFSSRFAPTALPASFHFAEIHARKIPARARAE